MEVVHLNKALTGAFPEIALRDLGFTDAGNNWGNYNEKYYELDCEVGSVYVVDFERVFISVGNSMRQMDRVTSLDQLQQLVSLL